MHIKTNSGQGPAARRVAFTLVEVVVSMLVIGVMVVALYGGLAWCLSSVRIARENLRATQVLVEKMEVVRLLTWDQISSNNILPAQFTAPYASSIASAKNNTNNFGITVTNSGGFLYYGAITLTPPVDTQLLATYTNDLLVVIVEVAWTNRGLPHYRHISSYVSRYGIQNYALN